MKSYIIAWRNLWRNKRRTLITVSSVFFAVILALIMRSMQLGSYGKMFQNAIESYSGYIQIQHEDFLEEMTIDNSFALTDSLIMSLSEDPNVSSLSPRIESFALASSGNLTKGVLVLGIVPESETSIKDIKSSLVMYRLDSSAVAGLMNEPLDESTKELIRLFEGTSFAGSGGLMADLAIDEKDSAAIMPILRKHSAMTNGYIDSGEPGVLLGDKLSLYLDLKIGDTIVLISQGYHGATAAGKYPVRGIVKLPLPDVDSRVVYIPLDLCQEFYNAPGMVSSLTVGVKSSREKAVNETVDRLRSRTGKTMRVLHWKEINEVLVTQMDLDNKQGMLMIGILYLVIAFGVFGTVLMLTSERRREFGVLVAVGMQKSKLAMVMVMELIYMGLIGIGGGVAVGIPVVIYGFHHPIRMTGELAKTYEDYGIEAVLAFQSVDTYFLWQSVIVALIVILAALYPVRKIMTLKVINALRA